jgi:hypothetical protein
MLSVPIVRVTWADVDANIRSPATAPFMAMIVIPAPAVPTMIVTMMTGERR